MRKDSVVNKIKNEVAELLNTTKLSYTEIGKKFGLSRGPVLTIKKQLGIKRSNIRKNDSIPCKWCTKPARYIKSKTRLNRYKYCSKDCYTQWQQSDENKGINNPNWKGGWENLKWIYDSAEWIEWRTFVYKRDNYTCQECNKKGGKLHPHHILYRKDYPDLIFDKNNGITLCSNCHSTVHGFKDKKEFYKNRYQEKITNSLMHQR